jgi:hypothetical protein
MIAHDGIYYKIENLQMGEFDTSGFWADDDGI